MNARSAVLVCAVLLLALPTLAQNQVNQPTTGTLQPGVVPIPDDGSVVISNVTPTSITLSGNVPQLKPGSVIAGGPPPGVMRRVVSLGRSGNSVTLQTTDAALTDVFSSLHLHYDGPVEFGKPTYLCKGCSANGYKEINGQIVKDDSPPN